MIWYCVKKKLAIFGMAVILIVLQLSGCINSSSSEIKLINKCDKEIHVSITAHGLANYKDGYFDEDNTLPNFVTVAKDYEYLDAYVDGLSETSIPTELTLEWNDTDKDVSVFWWVDVSSNLGHSKSSIDLGSGFHCNSPYTVKESLTIIFHQDGSVTT